FTQVHAETGAHVEVLEIDDLVVRVESADAAAVERKGQEIRETFELADAGVDPIAGEITPEIFEWSARVAVGLDRLVEDFALDGPGHLAIADGRPVARALELYHGKAGAGLSIEMKVRLGPVTILGVTQTADGRLKLVAAEGESIPGPTFRIGNTNSRIRFAAA